MMPKLTRIDRATARMVSEKAEQELQKVFASFGLDVTRGNARYTDGSMSVKFEFALPKAKAESKSQDSTLLGFDRNIVGMKFFQRRKEFTIMDIHLRKPKYPVIAEDANGRRFKFDVRTIVRALDGQAKFKGVLPNEPWYMQ